MQRTPKYNLPYAEPADYIRNYPDQVSSTLATTLDDVLENVEWFAGDVGNPDANTLTDPGVYFVSASSGSQNLPDKKNGTLTVTGNSRFLLQHFTEWSTGTMRSWVRRLTSEGWEAWQSSTWRQNNLGSGTDLNNIRTPGLYSAPATLANWPDGKPGMLEVIPYASAAYQRFTTVENKIYLRNSTSTGWTSWVRLPNGGEVDSLSTRVEFLEDSAGTGSTLPIRRGEHDMRVEGIRSRIAPVRANGKGVVALVCDHGSAAFESIILPKLRQHGMKSTLAMCSAGLESNSAEVDSWSTVAGWSSNDRVEIACHSKTHLDVTGTPNLVEEIITSRNELEANLGTTVDSWVQPGARNAITPGETYDGFMDGQGAHRYLTTAGELIWNGYGMATGSVGRPGSQAASRVFPLTGQPPLGPSRRFIDGGTADGDAAKAMIDYAAENGGRCIVSMHPEYIGRSGFQTQTEAESFIDWLAARAAAGDILLVQLREWAIAEN